MSEAAPIDPIDLSRVLAQINQEVERRRASGDLPADFERELDRTFAQFAPVDALNADFDSIVAKIERAAVIDIRPPTLSAYPGAAQMKVAVAKATAFYVRHVATQASGLFQALARALRLLGERVDEIERGQLRGGAGGADGPSASLPPPRWTGTATDAWDDFVLTALAGLAGEPGRVLHAHADDGRLVRRLVDGGFDAYGVEPSEEAALAASDLVPDVRAVGVAEHLIVLPAGSLGAVVLSGCVETLSVPSIRELLELVASRLVPGGTLVVLSAHPVAWLRRGPPLAVDLADGRPLRPETWQELLGRAGFVGSTVRLGAVPTLVDVPQPSDPAGSGLAEACATNFARLAGAVLVPEDFAVSGRLPH